MELSHNDPVWKAVFTPKSLIIIGKTQRFKGGYMFIRALKKFGFPGKIYVVSTDGEDFSSGISATDEEDCDENCLDIEVIPSIDELAEGIEFAILAVPAREIPDTILALGEKGVKAAQIFSSGFGDLETDEGRRREADLRKASKESGVRVIGPNCLGVFSSEGGLAFPPGVFPRGAGDVGLVSQSGGTAQSITWRGKVYNYFLNIGVSIGNSVDLTVEDFLEYMAYNPEIRVIAIYVEGVRDGARFIRLIKEASKEKPVILLKAGLSDAGIKATSSHTGILAGKSEIWEGAIRQAGGIMVETFDELTETISAFTKKKGKTGKRIALINRGGGEGVIAADLLPRNGLEVPFYSKETRKRLSDLIPDAGTGVINPLDFSAVGGFPGVFEKIFETIDADKNTDIIIYQHHIEFAHLFGRGYNRYLMDALISFNEHSKKMLLVVLPLYYSEDEWFESLKYLNSKGVSAHQSITGAMKAALHLSGFKNV